MRKLWSRLSLRDRQRVKRVSAVWAGGSALYVGANLDRVPVTDRLRLCAIPISMEARLGAFLAGGGGGAERAGPVDPHVEACTRAIAGMIVDCAEREFFHPKEGDSTFPWTVSVVESDQVNAYCAPGGRIVVFTGLIKFCAQAELEHKVADSAACVAAVLGHEVGHAVARHAAERLSWYPVIMLPAYAALIAMSPFVDQNALDVVWNVFRGGLLYLLELPQSRKAELEADLLGTEMLMRAGMSPEAMPEFLALLQGEAPAEWASTHPSSDRRVRGVTAYLEVKKPPPVEGGGGGTGGADTAQATLHAARLAFVHYYQEERRLGRGVGGSRSTEKKKLPQKY